MKQVLAALFAFVASTHSLASTPLLSAIPEPTVPALAEIKESFLALAKTNGNSKFGEVFVARLDLDQPQPRTLTKALKNFLKTQLTGYSTPDDLSLREIRSEDLLTPALEAATAEFTKISPESKRAFYTQTAEALMGALESNTLRTFEGEHGNSFGDCDVGIFLSGDEALILSSCYGE